LPRTDVPDIAVVDGLVAWYRFEDAANTAIDATNALGVGADQTAFDGSVNGASFVPNGGVRDVLTGTNSGAYDFDGVDDFIQPSQQPIDTTVDFTAMCFIKPDDTDRARILNTNDNKNGFRLVYENESITNTLFEDSDVEEAFPKAPNVTTGSFTHVAVTLDATSAEAKLFTDGVLQETITSDGSGSDAVTLEIGGSDFFNLEFFSGIIDDVRIYNRALSSSEITQIYTNTDPDQ
jgi:hypothetical protein